MYLSSHTIMDLAKLHSELIQEADRQRLADRAWRKPPGPRTAGAGTAGRATHRAPARAGPRGPDSLDWTDLSVRYAGRNRLRRTAM